MLIIVEKKHQLRYIETYDTAHLYILENDVCRGIFRESACPCVCICDANTFIRRNDTHEFPENVDLMLFQSV